MIIIVNICKNYYCLLIMFYLQEKNLIVFKSLLKTFLSGEKREGEMVP